MKICFIAPKAYQLFNPKVRSTFGGAEVQLALLAKEFSKRNDLTIDFMVADYGQKDIEEYDGVKVWKSLNFKQGALKQFLYFFRVFRSIHADIYIQRTLTPYSGLIALYCRLKRKKFIYMVAHDNETDRTHYIYRNLFTRFLANLNFKLANKVITQNQSQQENLFEKNVNNYPFKSSYPIEEILLSDKEYILWVGRSEDWKQPELFLELARSMPQEEFVMICPPSTGNPDYSTEIEMKASKIKNLQFIKFIPFEEIDNYFMKAKVFVNTSTQEGFPNTFIQAAKNKTPILSLSVHPNEFMIEYNCGFCCNGDVDLLKENLQKLLLDKELYGQMSENAYTYAKENHDIVINTKKIIKIIQNDL